MPDTETSIDTTVIRKTAADVNLVKKLRPDAVSHDKRPFQVFYRSPNGEWYRNIGEDEHDNSHLLEVSVDDLEYMVNRSYVPVKVGDVSIRGHGALTKVEFYRY